MRESQKAYLGFFTGTESTYCKGSSSVLPSIKDAIQPCFDGELQPPTFYRKRVMAIC